MPILVYFVGIQRMLLEALCPLNQLFQVKMEQHHSEKKIGEK